MSKHSNNDINRIIRLYHSDEIEEAENACYELLTTYPQSPVVINILGAVVQAQGRLREAIRLFDDAIKINPNYAEAYSNRGIALQELGYSQEAIDNYNKAIYYKPTLIQAYSNRGVLYQKQGHLNKALESYDKAIRFSPDYALAYNNRGSVLKDLGRLDDALKSYNNAIQYQPDYVEAYSNRGVVLKDLGRLDKALESYDQAIHLDPSYADAYSNRNFVLNYSSAFSPLEVFHKHLEFESYFGKKNPENTKDTFANRKRNFKLRVGYVSPDFRLHSVAYFFETLLRSHSGSIETYCYYNGTIIDNMTRCLMSEADHWRSISGVNDIDVVSLINNDNIDILVDLAGHTAGNRLIVFAHKPAPIQVAWLGYPNTTGLSAIDYRFTDNVADPVGSSDSLYSEKLIRLPHGFLCYQGDNNISPSGALPCLKKNNITFGSFNNLNKVTPFVVQVWARILQAVSGSHLLLKSKQFSSAQIQQKYINMFQHEGISEDRIELYSWFSNKEDHFDLYESIDIGLDPFPYNGATTTCEALWMGIPVITLSGDRHAGRVGASIMTHVGLEKFIAADISEYVDIAIQYANNIEYLGKIRGELRDKMKTSTLYDAEQFARGIEKAYQEMKKDAIRSQVLHT